MAGASIHNIDARVRLWERRWDELCTIYLPLVVEGSIWRYRQPADANDPDCGWKLHISATVLNAHSILKRVAPILVGQSVQFKAARSLAEIYKLNSGLYYNYTQIGKVITVYPRNENQAVSLAAQLHQLTRRFKGPSVSSRPRGSDRGSQPGDRGGHRRGAGGRRRRDRRSRRTGQRRLPGVACGCAR